MNDDSLAALQALNAKFIHNFITRDVTSHDAIIHERFVCIMPDGARMNRKDYLNYWATGSEGIIHYDYRDERIAIFGNVGLVSSTTKRTRLKDGIEVTGMTFYTDTYLQEGKVWKCIQAQLTGVQPEHHPSDDTIVKTYIHGKLVPNRIDS